MVKFKENHTDTKIPRWLNAIQENSWEAELLLSAVLLFGLIQTPIYLANWVNHLLAWHPSSAVSIAKNIIQGLEILRIGFIIHIIVRAMWIAQVGFSYVYPKGINKKNLRFKGKFNTELTKNQSHIDSIMSLEKIASVIFAISFSLFGLLMGFLFYATPYILMALALTKNWVGDLGTVIFIVFMVIYALLSLLVAIDFITNGFFRRGIRRAKFFYPISWFFRIMTLSFLYRKTILTITSNAKGYKKYLVTGGLVFIVFYYDDMSDQFEKMKITTYAENTQQGHLQNANYELKRDEEDILVASIPNDIIEGSVLPLFLKHQQYYNLKLKKIPKASAEKNTRNFLIKTDSLVDYAVVLRDKLEISFDSSIVEEVKWIKTVHPTTFDKGYITYIDISNLSADYHFLKIRYLADTTANSLKQDSLIVNIPFYKSSSMKSVK